jgi:hypothetical protein
MKNRSRFRGMRWSRRKKKSVPGARWRIFALYIGATILAGAVAIFINDRLEQQERAPASVLERAGPGGGR